jgi:hypothetical protein
MKLPDHQHDPKDIYRTDLKTEHNMKTRTSIYHRTFAFAYLLLVAVVFCGKLNENDSKRTN